MSGLPTISNISQIYVETFLATESEKVGEFCPFAAQIIEFGKSWWAQEGFQNPLQLGLNLISLLSRHVKLLLKPVPRTPGLCDGLLVSFFRLSVNKLFWALLVSWQPWPVHAKPLPSLFRWCFFPRKTANNNWQGWWRWRRDELNEEDRSWIVDRVSETIHTVKEPLTRVLNVSDPLEIDAVNTGLIFLRWIPRFVKAGSYLANPWHVESGVKLAMLTNET